MAGAHVIGLIRSADREALVRGSRGTQVVTGNDVSAAREHSPYDLVLESLGGEVLADTLAMLAPEAPAYLSEYLQAQRVASMSEASPAARSSTGS